MLELKQHRDVSWDDMARIEDPIAAKAEIESVFYQTDGLDSIWGIRDVIQDYTDGPASRDEGTLRQLQDALEWGRIFLLKSEPCHPVVCWKKDDSEQLGGSWVKTQYVHPSIGWTVDSLLESIQPIRLASGRPGEANGQQQDETDQSDDDDFDETGQQQPRVATTQAHEIKDPVVLAQTPQSSPLVVSTTEVASVSNMPLDSNEPVDSETPIQIILLVPGTTDPVNTDSDKHGANRDYWKDSELLEQLKDIAKGDVNIKLNYEHFSWSGDNTVESRGQNNTDTTVNPVTDAGQRLRRLLYARENEPFYQGWKNRPLHFHLIGHSHGGNVMNEFTQAIKTDFPSKWKIKSLTYLSTPFFNQLHPIDGSHFHKDIKLIFAHNRYDITQQAIANYTVKPLEETEQLIPKLKGFATDVKDKFMTIYDKIISLGGEFFLRDNEETVNKWRTLAVDINRSAESLNKQWLLVKKELQGYQTIDSTSMLELGNNINLRYSQWAQAAQSRLNQQANDFSTATEEERDDNNYFSLSILYDETNPVALMQILVAVTGTNILNSPLFNAIDDMVKSIIDIFDNTLRLPPSLPDNVSKAAIMKFDVSSKDAYHTNSDENGNFNQFLSALETNQKNYSKAVANNDMATQKTLRQTFLYMLLGQVDYTALIQAINKLNWGERLTVGNMDTVIGQLRDNLQWMLDGLEEQHEALMLVDDLLFHYSLKYQQSESPDKKTVLGFKEWIEGSVLVDQERLTKRLDAHKLDDDASLTQLKKSIDGHNGSHTYNVGANGLLNEATLRGSLVYLATTSHSVSRQKFYELSPDVKTAFMSCL